VSNLYSRANAPFVSPGDVFTKIAPGSNDFNDVQAFDPFWGGNIGFIGGIEQANGVPTIVNTWPAGGNPINRVYSGYSNVANFQNNVAGNFAGLGGTRFLSPEDQHKLSQKPIANPVVQKARAIVRGVKFKLPGAG
jgi:hypothetical protein